MKSLNNIPTLLSMCLMLALSCFSIISKAKESKAKEETTKKAVWTDYYTIEKVAYPKAIDPQIGGLDALDDGRIALALHSGDIVIFDPKKDTWSTFATGLHEPLGIQQESDNTFVVMQKPELTRIVDKNGDGKADYYQALYDEFGMTGNYHEFAFGPAVDSKGNYYVALNVASNYAGINEHIRGEYSSKCNPQVEMQKWHDKKAWIQGYRKQVTRMYSCAPYRGWIMKISPEGNVEPFASGFRSPAGLHVDSQDRLWVTDNQGDWIPTSPLHLVEEGNFYGHPAALNWQPDWPKAHKDVMAKDLMPIKTAAAGLFPQGELANSPTQPLATIDRALFGLPEGELIIGDMNTDHLIRFLPDEVGGTMQGTLIPFIAGDELGIGNFRLDFSPDGTLWVGKIHLGWAGDEGLLKITQRNISPFIVDQVKQVTSGFEISFSQKLKNIPDNITVTSHGYHYHKDYGSKKVNLQTEQIIKHKLNRSGTTLTIHFEKLHSEKLYTIDLSALTSEVGNPLMGDVLRYNVVTVK